MTLITLQRAPWASNGPNHLGLCRETQTATSNPTPNFQIIADNEAGLLFKNKR